MGISRLSSQFYFERLSNVDVVCYLEWMWSRMSTGTFCFPQANIRIRRTYPLPIWNRTASHYWERSSSLCQTWYTQVQSRMSQRLELVALLLLYKNVLSWCLFSRFRFFALENLVSHRFLCPRTDTIKLRFRLHTATILEQMTLLQWYLRWAKLVDHFFFAEIRWCELRSGSEREMSLQEFR